VGRPVCKLRLFPVTDRPGRCDRAFLLVGALAARRPLAEEGEGWTLSYPGLDPTEAFGRCAAELDAIDPSWVEVLDFVAVGPRRAIGHARGRPAARRA
jgi:hypothetical protein